jgi:hypothetical protein
MEAEAISEADKDHGSRSHRKGGKNPLKRKT